jgi:UDP-N-acetylmuramoyl-tripeptide--D-alanyl-D-alanine ligase
VKPRSLSDIARAVGGRALGDDVEISSVVIDSREAKPGALFLALPGERQDGADFVADAFARGAAAVVVREAIGLHGPTIVVQSTNDALLALGSDERRWIGGTVVGITGANGKTSTKDMTAAACAARLHTHASPASLNNEIGLPLTLLGTPADAEVVIAELGARHVGDVAFLCSIARPAIVVVTNVGVAHMEVFGSWDKIVEASAEPVAALDDDGIAVLNADDRVVSGYADRSAGRVITFGRAQNADVRADRVRLGLDGRASFELVSKEERVRVGLPMPGEHMVSNALAATAVASELGVPLDEIATALESVGLSHWRMETFTTREGVRVVNDAYNANPESTAAALRSARWMAGDARLIAVLGTMAELGPIALEEHERIGELTARLGVDRVLVVGEAARPIAAAAVREGVEPDRVAAYDDPGEALADVRAHAHEGDVVLFKGSRVAGLERLAEALR